MGRDWKGRFRARVFGYWESMWCSVDTYGNSLSKQGISWQVSHHHIAGSCLVQSSSRLRFFFCTWPLPKYRFLIGSHTQAITSCAFKAGFHYRRSRSRSRNQKGRRYDLVKNKPTESEAEHWFCYCLRRLRSSENCIFGVASRSGRINQWQCSIPGFAIGWFFRFCFRLRQPSFHWIISDWVVNWIGRNGNVLILPTPIPSSLWLCLRLWFSIFTRS